MSPRYPQSFHGQLFFRHSVHLPFRILTRKSLIVWASYVHRAALWRKSDQLLYATVLIRRVVLLTSRPSIHGWLMLLPQLMSHLISPQLRAHSTRGTAASKAFSSGVSMHYICNTAGWSTPSDLCQAQQP